MALFARTSVPRFSSTTTSSQFASGKTRWQITIPAGATSVHISTAEAEGDNLPVYVGPNDTDNGGFYVGSRGEGEDRAHLFIELGAGAELWSNNDIGTTATSEINLVWMYD